MKKQRKRDTKTVQVCPETESTDTQGMFLSNQLVENRQGVHAEINVRHLNKAV